jgi:predicted nucleic acid-binding protein
MDRLFLDANVLFSAAYRADAGLRRLWRLRCAVLCSSRYAVEEAKFNLTEEAQRRRLAALVRKLSLFDPILDALPSGIALPEKDAPILLAAIVSRATHLLTGDLRDFGPYFGKRIAGILIILPGDYLRSVSPHR